MKQHKIIGCLWSILMTFALLEVGLRAVDPLGIHRFYQDLNIVRQGFENVPGRAYWFRPGYYTMSDWQATILPDHSRRVPDTAERASCTLVFLGDSITFGLSVDDEETWVNRLARQWPDVRMINAGVPAYNSASIRAVWQDYIHANAIVYLIWEDDTAPKSRLGFTVHDFALREYADFLTYIYLMTASAQDEAGLDADLLTLSRDSRMTLVAFDKEYGQDLQMRYPVTLIPSWHSAISWADGHADAAGNREIAQAMAPIVAQAIKQQCP